MNIMITSADHLLPIIADTEHRQEFHPTAQDDIDNRVVAAKDFPSFLLILDFPILPVLLSQKKKKVSA